LDDLFIAWQVERKSMKLRMAIALVGSCYFVLLLIGVDIVYDIERTPAGVPAFYDDTKLIDILNPKRKHNPIDDFVLTRPIP
jgi:hypothetical protein